MDLRKVYDLQNKQYMYINFDQITRVIQSRYMCEDVTEFYLTDCSKIITKKVNLTPVDIEQKQYEPTVRKENETDIQFRDRVRDKITKWINKQN